MAKFLDISHHMCYDALLPKLEIDSDLPFDCTYVYMNQINSARLWCAVPDFCKPVVQIGYFWVYIDKISLPTVHYPSCFAGLISQNAHDDWFVIV